MGDIVCRTRREGPPESAVVAAAVLKMVTETSKSSKCTPTMIMTMIMKYNENEENI